MGRPLDIHRYAVQYERALALVGASGLLLDNERRIRAYATACLVQQWCGTVRLIRVLGVLVLFGRTVQQDFGALTRADVEAALAAWRARTPPYTAETLGTYKQIIKRFLWWVHSPATFEARGAPPAIVAWMSTTVRRRDKRHLDRHELLTPAEIERLLHVARDPRDRALASILWETGGRIAEVGNLTMADVTPHEHGYLLDVRGKTGARTVLIVASAPHLAQWLAHHPAPHDPDSPLWVDAHPTRVRHLSYAALRQAIRRLVARAGITKRVHLHLFRHSRATYVLAAGIMNETQAKRYFGWTPDTNMLGTYAHLIDTDANNAILREHHLTPATPAVAAPPVWTCPRCQAANAPTSIACTTCAQQRSTLADPGTALLALLMEAAQGRLAARGTVTLPPPE